MAKLLYKKSYQLKSLRPTKFDELWGKKGIFTTIRVIGKKPKFILFKNHLNRINLSLKKMHIDFKISNEHILQLFKPDFQKINNSDNLLRIAICSKKLSLSLRARLKPYKKFIGILYPYKRSKPDIKNLHYKKIIKLLSTLNTQKEEILLTHNDLLLEGCTTNLLCINNKTIHIPKNNYYSGVTMNYLLNNSKRKIKKTNISIHSLHKYQEILLVGSGKGVISLSSIPQLRWRVKSDLIYQELKNLYKQIL